MNVLAPVPTGTVEAAVVQLLEEKHQDVPVSEVFYILGDRYAKYEVGPAIETLVFRGEVVADHYWKYLRLAHAN